MPCAIACRKHVHLPLAVIFVASRLFSSLEAGSCVLAAARQSKQVELRSHCLRPDWLLNSLSFVDVPDETVTVPAVCRECTVTFLAHDDTACKWSETRKSTIPATWL